MKRVARIGTAFLALALAGACGYAYHGYSPSPSTYGPGSAGGREDLGLTPTGVDELWVVARDDTAPPPEGPTQTEESPAMRAVDGDREVPLPLKHTDVRVRIAAYVASVEVEQQYHNPYDEKIEVV